MDTGLVVALVATVIVILSGIVLAVRTHHAPGRPDDGQAPNSSDGGGGG
ncbi:hypothetical protein IOD16_06355 [Saccharothrix sp. 6-C]|nr:hypothetical protein [Saccharothrix sp. 6-C]QQQ78094.1 hypothetical protein IOD16_06355 [Saccharothrix sp. 6-C]